MYEEDQDEFWQIRKENSEKLKNKEGKDEECGWVHVHITNKEKNA